MKLKALLAVLILASCQTEVKVKNSLLQHMPQDAAFIVHINDFSKFQSELKNNTFTASAKSLPLFEDLFKKLEYIDFPESKIPLALGLYEIGKGDFDFFLLTKDKLPEIAIADVANKTVEQFTYENQSYTRYTLNGTPIFTTGAQNVSLISSSQLLLENFIRTAQTSIPLAALEKLERVSDTMASANVYLNLEHSSGILKKYLKNKTIDPLSGFADWIGFDFSADQNRLSLSGICLANDSTKKIVNLFKGDSPLPSTLSTVLPQATNALVSYTLNDTKGFIQKQNSYLDRATPKDTLFTTIEEIGLVRINNQKIVVLNSYGSEVLKEKLSPFTTTISNYQNKEIYGLNATDLLDKNLNPLISGFSSKFYTVIENTFAFAEQRETLQNFISNSNRGTSFSTSKTHQTSTAAMANEANLTFLANDNGLQQLIAEDFTPAFTDAFNKLGLEDYAYASQFIADTGFLHANITISKNKEVVANNTVGSLFTVALDTDLATDPQFVKNHRTGKQEIVVQDIDNYLYLISTEGKVLWKKQLGGKIRGKIHQVDLYKNGKLQLAFCTNNQFIVLDRNGKVVAPFEMTFESGNLNALAVFDYEKSRNYRFVVTQGRKVFMYDSQGKIVDGFVYKEAEHAVLDAPEHFRISGKDYLAFRLDNNTITFRHRAGQERIKVAPKIDFSDNGTFLYKNKFSLTDKKGVLFQIDTKGKVSQTNFNLGEDHGMFATSKTLALMDENVLSIRGKKVELDLGVYTAPKIFYIYDKIYVGVTDLQNQQIYLFDSQAKPIADFPVYGTSLIDLSDIDRDKKIEVVAKDQENSVIVYQIN